MSNQRYSPEFKDEAVRQVVDRGYSVPKGPQSPSTKPAVTQIIAGLSAP